MKNIFITAEYNPFHNGHKYQIDFVKQKYEAYIIAIMSGNFTQRGEPALFDKFTRSECAVKCGVDLCIELPLPWCIAPAQGFCSGSAELALASGIADGFAFGTENCTVSDFVSAAEFLNRSDTVELISAVRKQQSYPSAVSSVVPDNIKKAVSSPNNILGVEYTRCLLKNNFGGEIIPVERKNVSHDGSEIKDEFASASYIRNLYRSGVPADEFVPAVVWQIYSDKINDGDFISEQSFYERQIISILRQKQAEDFLSVSDSDGGIGQRLYNSVQQYVTLDDICMNTKSKRFTFSGIRRRLYNTVLNIPKGLYKEKPPYIKVLAFNGNGSSLLRQIKNNSDIPIITKKSDTAKLNLFGKKIYELECRATDLYNSLTVHLRPCGTEMSDKIYTEKNNE